jgi:hypothetical protein
MERVDCIHELINMGRSKGVSVLIGLQSYEGLASVYGDLGANDIMSQCGNKMFLRVGGPRTASWAQEFFGNVRRIERSFSQSHGPGGRSTSESFSLQDRPMFLASYFLNLPLTGPDQPYIAVCDVPSLGETLIVERTFEEVKSCCHDPASAVPGIWPRPDPADQHLLPWTAEEEAQFCKPPAKEASGSQPGVKTGSQKHRLPPPRHIDD